MVRLLDYTPATSTDAHQEKLDLVKHSDDATKHRHSGARWMKVLRDMEGKLVELVIADLVLVMMMMMMMMMMCDFYITTRKELNRWDVQVVSFLRSWSGKVFVDYWFTLTPALENAKVFKPTLFDDCTSVFATWCVVFC